MLAYLVNLSHMRYGYICKQGYANAIIPQNLSSSERERNTMAEETTYLELSQDDGGAHKFYEVVINDTEVNIRYGRIGDQGQKQASTHATTEIAQKFAQKKIREKVQK